MSKLHLGLLKSISCESLGSDWRLEVDTWPHYQYFSEIQQQNVKIFCLAWLVMCVHVFGCVYIYVGMCTCLHNQCIFSIYFLSIKYIDAYLLMKWVPAKSNISSAVEPCCLCSGYVLRLAGALSSAKPDVHSISFPAAFSCAVLISLNTLSSLSQRVCLMLWWHTMPKTSWRRKGFISVYKFAPLLEEASAGIEVGT